jgi:hypothetical protein
MTRVSRVTAGLGALLSACAGCPNGIATFSFDQIEDGHPPCPIEPVEVQVVNGILDFETFAGRVEGIDGGDECTYYQSGWLDLPGDVGTTREVLVRGVIVWQPGVTETELFVQWDGPLVGDVCEGNYLVRITFE